MTVLLIMRTDHVSYLWNLSDFPTSVSANEKCCSLYLSIEQPIRDIWTGWDSSGYILST